MIVSYSQTFYCVLQNGFDICIMEALLTLMTQKKGLYHFIHQSVVGLRKDPFNKHL